LRVLVPMTRPPCLGSSIARGCLHGGRARTIAVSAVSQRWQAGSRGSRAGGAEGHDRHLGGRAGPALDRVAAGAGRGAVRGLGAGDRRRPDARVRRAGGAGAARGRAGVLKVSWMDSETEHEGLALSVWDGRGAQPPASPGVCHHRRAAELRHRRDDAAVTGQPPPSGSAVLTNSSSKP